VTTSGQPGGEDSGVASVPRLTLRREPFSPVHDEDFFYPEAQRAKCLKFLLHLAPYSDALLLTGPPGSGKSCLIQQIIAHCSPSWRICQIEADIATDANSVLQKLADVFLFDASPERSLEQRIADMHKMLKAQRNSALSPVVIIDDAHLVGLPILHFLASLLDYDDKEDRLMCLILAGRDELKERMSAPSLELLRSKVGHAFELTSFSEEDTRAYIEHRLAVAGGGDEAVFTSAEFKAIHEESGGIPGKINVCAMRALNTLHENAPPPRERRSQSLGSMMGRLSLSWRNVGIVAAVLIFAVILIMQDEINQTIEPENVAQDQGVATDNTETKPALQVTRFPWEDAPPGEDEEQPVVEEAPPAIASEELIKHEDEAPIQTTGKLEEGGAAQPSADDATMPDADTPVLETVEEAPVIEGKPELVAGASLVEAGEEIEIVNEREPGISESTPQIAARPAERRENWILSRNPQHFTLQLMAMDEPKVKRLVEEWGIGGDVAYYTTDRGLLAVLYGDFPSRQAGEAAADELLKGGVRGIKPWVRSFGSIQGKVRSAGPAPATAGTSRLLADEDSLLKRDPRHYTLQLMAMDLDAVTKRVKQWGMESQVIYFRTLKRDQELIAVTYGDYATRQEAVEGSRALTARIRGIKPWIRQFGSVHDAITDFRAVSR